LDHDKESACGCAGCFTAPNTMSLLAHVFEDAGALDQLRAFACENGPAFYGLPANTGTLTLKKQDTPVKFPSKIETPEGQLTVFDPGFDVFWSAE
jgi:dihydroorotase